MLALTYKRICLFFILSLLLTNPDIKANEVTNIEEEQFSSTVQAISSLLFHINEEINLIDRRLGISSENELLDPIKFDELSVSNLWNKAKSWDFNQSVQISQKRFFLEEAFLNYFQAQKEQKDLNLIKARKFFFTSFLFLNVLWHELNEQSPIAALKFYDNSETINDNPLKRQIAEFARDEASSFIQKYLQKEKDPFTQFFDILSYNDFDSNPYLTKEARKQIRPFLLPFDHCLRPVLDSIFFQTRAIQDQATFESAGFMTLFVQPRSFIRVASHPCLPNYLVKIYLDNELRQKQGKPDWYWFVKRCEGAKAIRKAIIKKKIQFFSVPDKWIYPLPLTPSPPSTSDYLRKVAILLVQDMKLVSHEETLEAWKTKITPKHLDELYAIISRASGGSYRASNVPYTIFGDFAFIDTEYPDRKDPDFSSIRPFLSHDMRKYWDKLVKNGG